jgi:hypothetical protein
VATSSLGMVEFFNLVSRLPRWFWIMTGGSAVIAVISAASQYLLPPECLARAVWSTTQLGLGIVVLIAAQVWALIVMAPEDDRLSAKDIIFAIRLWALVSKRLPAMARQLWLGVWAGSAMLCAIFLVGGLSYWTRYYKPERVADKNLIQAAMALAQGKADNKSLTESVEDFAATQQELTKQKPEKDDNKVDKRPTVHCVILGYNLGPDKQLTELVLGTLRDSSVRYAGRVQQGFSPEQSKQLLEAMKNLVVTAPLIADLQFPAIWVKPQLFCEVHQSGYDDQGHLKNPRYHGLLIVE